MIGGSDIGAGSMELMNVTLGDGKVKIEITSVTIIMMEEADGEYRPRHPGTKDF